MKKDEVNQELSTLDNEENQKILDQYEPKKKKFTVTNEDVKDGLNQEEFDINTELPFSDLTNEDIEGKECVKVNYDLESKEVIEALKKFQKLTIYKKNMIYTMILLIIFFGYLVQYLKTPENGMSMFLSVISISVICVVWFMPLNHVKKMGKAIDDGEKISFYLELYDTCLIIGDEDKTVIEFSKVKTTCFETELLFGIGVGKERVFIIPKRCITQSQEDQIREMLKI